MEHAEPRFRQGDPLPPPPEAYQSILTNYEPPKRERYWLHALLFLVTIVSTLWAGGEWAGRAGLWERSGFGLFLDPVFMGDGVRYAFPFLLFLTVHEFGHYLTARRYRIDASLPYYIPVPPGLPILNIGTFGAVIRIRERIKRTTHLFDVGVAGPLAGFVIAFGVLVYGVATIPPVDYVMTFGPGHEPLQEYVAEHGTFPDEPARDEFGFGPIALGDTILFALIRWMVPDMPPAWEMYHYPVLFAGWLALFFTALNLLPVGQLDGGHVTYSLFGKRGHRMIARAAVLGLLFSGGLGAVVDIGGVAALTAADYGYPPWLGDLFTWIVVLLVLRWLVGKLFQEWRTIFITWAGLAAAIAIADSLGFVAGALAWSGWLLWGALIVFVIRVDHPGVSYHEDLDPKRRALGIASIVIFVLCFSPRPLYIIM